MLNHNKLHYNLVRPNRSLSRYTGIVYMKRRTIHSIILILWFMIFCVIGFGAGDLRSGHLILIGYLFLSIVTYTVYAFIAKCRACGMPVLLRPLKLLGMDLYLWSLLTPKRCRHCDADL
jgi:hypothetical protein